MTHATNPAIIERAAESAYAVFRTAMGVSVPKRSAVPTETKKIWQAIARAVLASAIPEEVAELRAALKWVDQIYPGKNAESGGAIIHMTWNEWNALRGALGLKEQMIPDRASQTVRLIRARTTEQKGDQ